MTGKLPEIRTRQCRFPTINPAMVALNKSGHGSAVSLPLIGRWLH